MHLRLCGLLAGVAAGILPTAIRAQQAPPPMAGAPMLATDRYLFVLRGDSLYQFDVQSLKLLHAFDFTKAEARPPQADDGRIVATLDDVTPPPAAKAPVPVVKPAIDAALGWLAAHQDEDGKWDVDGFMKHDKGDPCSGAGDATHDVGITGLAMLAMLGNGSDLRSGPYRDNLRRAAQWLVQQQDALGRLGLPNSQGFIYDHAIATQALCEAYGRSARHQPLQQPAQRAIDYLGAARNPYGVWRYQPKDNDGDTSVTTWVLLALTSAKSFDLQVDPAALKTTAVFLDSVTGKDGRAGYTKAGEGSSRNVGMQDRFPAALGEALTAAALLGRFRLGQEPKREPIMTAGAELLLAKPPQWQPDRIDAYYWYLGTAAMARMGGRYWTEWARHLQAVVDAQRRDGNCAGSWDPIGVWDTDGGRVFATALYAMTLGVVQSETK